jgi:glutathione synthetase
MIRQVALLLSNHLFFSYICCCHRYFSLPIGALAFTPSSSLVPIKKSSKFHIISLLHSSSSSSNSETMSSPTTTAATIKVPHLTSSTLTNLVDYTISFSAANGLQVQQQKSQDSSTSSQPSTYSTAPISLLPQAYPRTQFRQGQKLSKPLNVLVDRISRNGQFLQKTLRGVRDVDEFTGMLLQLYEQIYLSEDEEDGVRNVHAKKADRLGILRSDYMLHSSSGSDGGYSIKQVELNTIASSFAGLASSVAKLHGFLTKRLLDEGLQEFLDVNERAVMGSCGASGDNVGEDGESNSRGVPTSLAMIRLPAAMAVAYNRYCARFNIGSNSSNEEGAAATKIKPAILFVVQPNETNTVDQRLLEFALWDNHEIPVVRMSLGEIYKRVTLDETSGRLTIDGEGAAVRQQQQEVAVVYFRAGYAPTDYPSGYNTADGSGVEWLARERLERGSAAKCPNLGYHLAGTKKVQQELARRGAVEQFFEGEGEEADVAAQIRTAFAGLYSLGEDANEEDMEAVKDVLLNNAHGQYVLKPQREGGGYNYYGENLANKLKENCTITVDDDGNNDVTLSPDLSEFILMERLFPPQQRAILLRNGQVEGTGMSISELGCFGAIVSSGDGEVVHNEYAGFLLRTKFSGVDEGGVASGFATLSSPYLC